MSTYPRRPKAEALTQRRGSSRTSSSSTDQVPNTRHLRILDTFSSVTSLAFLIQQDVEIVDEFRQHNIVVTVMLK